MSSKKALGRGLGAIFEDVEEAYSQDIKNSADLIREIDVDKIHPNPFQPRKYFNESAIKELAESIKKHGLLQPIIIVEKDDEYMLLAGERRLRATKEAGLSTIRAIVADYESDNLRELALIENIQREDLNPIELAIAYKELIEEYNITQEELSEIIKKSRTQITNTLRLLNLSEYTQKLLTEGKLSQGHAKTLVGLDMSDEKMVVDTVLGQKLSVRETEKLVKNLKKLKSNKNTKKKIKTSKKSLDLSEIEEKLKKLGLCIKVKSDSLIIKFEDHESIRKFLKKIT